MIPDLGKYQGAVLSAYGISILLLTILILIALWRAKTVKRQLDEVEKRTAKST